MKSSAFPRLKHLAAAGALAAIVLGAGHVAAQSPPATPLTPEEQNVVFLLVRQVLTPSLVGDRAVTDLPPRLLAQDEPDFFLALYYDGAPVLSAHVKLDAIATAAMAAAGELRRRCEKLALGETYATKGRLQFDIMTTKRPLKIAPEKSPLGDLKVGAEGLRLRAAGREDLFSPLAVLRALYSPAFLKALYESAGHKPPATAPAALTWEAFETLSYIEEKPCASAAPLFYGNVLTTAIDKDIVLRACVSAGKWLWQVQAPDGTFMERYDALLAKRLPDAEYTARIGAADGLYALYQLTQYPPFQQAADKVVGRAKTLLVDETIKWSNQGASLEIPVAYLRRGVAYKSAMLNANLKPQRAEPEETAILLQVIARRALVSPAGGGRAMLERMGRFLLLVTAQNGMVYRNLVDAVANAPPPEVSEGRNEEVALALCRLNELSPHDNWRRGLTTILDATARVHGDKPSPRLVTALGEYYLSTQEVKYGNLCLSLARKLLPEQHRDDGATPADVVGGYPRVELPPVSETADFVQAVSVACRVAGELKQEAPDLRAALRLGCRFLLNQQFRPDNSFFLARPALLEGGFHNAPRRYLLQLADAEKCLRALLAASLVWDEKETPKAAS